MPDALTMPPTIKLPSTSVNKDDFDINELFDRAFPEPNTDARSEADISAQLDSMFGTLNAEQNKPQENAIDKDINELSMELSMLEEMIAGFDPF